MQQLVTFLTITFNDFHLDIVLLHYFNFIIVRPQGRQIRQRKNILPGHEHVQLIRHNYQLNICYPQSHFQLRIVQ